jgi:2-polyprenyl-3-methyl-5-hydroxy-6-metoxy-1,4-benzoquinol methylase
MNSTDEERASRAQSATEDAAGYRHGGPECNESHSYLLPAVIDALSSLDLREKRIFEVGCGNGSVAARLAAVGYSVIGIDPSEDGISQARQHHPELRLERGSAYDSLHHRYGTFPAVVSLEVVEHVYFPRKYASTLYSLLDPGGTAIISTPFHGYWKNLALALSGKMDAHFTALWDYGHIKFWSIPTLTELLTEAGFRDVRFVRVGRIPSLAKSMIAIAKR